MLNIIMIHRNNQMGRKLYDLLSESLTGVECKEAYIMGIPFLEIAMKSEGNVRRVLNSPQSIKNYLDRETMYQMLELSGISFFHQTGDNIVKYYDVLIFDMTAISIRVRGEEPNPGKYIKESECVKITDMARKTIYVMGLDYGLVTIALTGKRKPRVIDISDSPDIRKKDMKVLLNKIILLRTQQSPSVDPNQEVKMGADPEFMLFNSRSGKMIAASDLFPREGIIGCDNIRIPNRQQRPVAEVRPNPATSPRQLTDNIKQALTIANKLAPYRNVRWVAGSHPLSGYSIGGHIHFSNIDINYALLRALDNYLGILVFLIENPVSAARRRKRYGNLADIRLKDYGGFEYRTLGSWLVTPQITCAVLCLAKIVAEHYLELSGIYLNSSASLRAFYEGNQEHFRPLFQKMWRELSNTSTFKEYQEELKLIAYMINNNIIWDEQSDLKNAWKIEGGMKGSYTSNTSQKKLNEANPVLNTGIDAPRRRASTNRGRSNNRTLTPEINSSPIHNARIVT